METRFFVLLVSVFLAGCISIPKPDWNPGGTKPKQYEEGKRPMCPLPAQWVWIDKEKQWLCVAVPSYYSYGYYYGPSLHYYGPTCWEPYPFRSCIIRRYP